MSERNTQNLPDSRSFEERLFARFDALDSGMDRMEARMERIEARLDDLTTRVERLEAESERRAAETKPIWERALAEIVALGQKVEAVEDKLDALAIEWLDLRGEQQRLKTRMNKLDSEHAR